MIFLLYSLTDTAKDKLNKLTEELNYFTKVISDIEGLHNDLISLSKEVKQLYVYDPDQETVEAKVYVSF